MKTIYVKFYSPQDVGMEESEVTPKTLKEWCIRAYKYQTAGEALLAYANTVCEWSTLLDEDADVEAFINEAIEHYMSYDWDWLEENFT